MNAEPKPTESPREPWTRPLASLASRPLRFLNETLWRQRPPTRWTTPNRVVREDDAHRLREFGVAKGEQLFIPQAPATAEREPNVRR